MFLPDMSAEPYLKGSIMHFKLYASGKNASEELENVL